MSHEITAIDRQQGIENAWHKLTEVLPIIHLVSCWLAQWDVRKSPLFTLDGAGKPIATDHCQLVATDNEQIRIGSPVHCDTYQPVTNKDFLSLVQDALSGIKGAAVASVGSVCGRGRVFVSVKLEQLPVFEAAGREFVPYLNFLNSHDQSSAFVVNTSNTCTVCNNTFRMNLSASGQGIRVKLKHTKNIATRLDNVGEVIDGFLGAQAEFRAVMETLNRQELARPVVKPLFAGFLSAPDLPKDLTRATKADLELSSRRANQIDRLTELHHMGAGNHGRTMADAFSAVSDYFTHESSGGEDMARQFVSSEFGAGQGHKARAFELFQSADEVRKLVQVGEAVLSAN